jgi:hypothetical protein
MSHFAQLDENNTVVQVVVVSDKDTFNEHGIEVEEIGQKFLQSLYGSETTWKQTSYNGSIRKNYAGIGYSYNEKLDAFIPPKPFDSWVLDKNLAYYVAPIPRPSEENKVYFWDEENQVWLEDNHYPLIIGE